ncbi:phosphatase PAP2 family protein [Flavobacterium sp.]|uniref:phosphatase PAP2 family protein n=1 Tax=Flavobacterium sp. TaxID=239 RepID=UPI00121A90D8|nr:phosphatase PAP2 family protein [Flavobacterium sp.]RZJ71416.1 MAG: phosphatase PAP2 family protein [Flavobacterium sp.]
MIEKLIELDRDLFVWLNSLGSDTYDGFWLAITKFWSWIPIFAIIFYLVFKRLGWRHALLILGCIALLITITDQTTNHIFKNVFQRLRPGNNPEIADLIRAVQKRSSFSFISGHASNSMAVAFFCYRVLHPYIKYMGFFFLWPLIFAYSRIYLGLHYPGDILAGYTWGILMGFLMTYLYAYLRNRFFPEQKENLDQPTNSEPVADGQ